MEASEWILSVTGARAVHRRSRVQSLWGGYGELLRFTLEGHELPSVVLKRIVPPHVVNADRSHQRKLRSYRVEMAFYQRYAALLTPMCRVARLLGAHRHARETWLLLEDLDAAGFRERRRSLSARERDACLAWLAHFHAAFFGCEPQELWPVGTYWHLATRPDELARVTDPRIRQAAPEWDRQLNACRFSTLVHGDAKPANFCFASDTAEVAAVDFQYVGGGAGIKDVAYLLHGESASTVRAGLDTYFATLACALTHVDAIAVEREWRELFPIATRDFERFLHGWR